MRGLPPGSTLHGNCATFTAACLAARRAPPSKQTSTLRQLEYNKPASRLQMYYSFIIPAYNESERLATSLPKVFVYIRERKIQAEVIVGNDGSSDDTAEIARSFASRYPQIRLLENPGNRGKGYSVRNGMLHAHGDILLFTDADLSPSACCTPTATFCCLLTRTCRRPFTKRPSCSQQLRGARRSPSARAGSRLDCKLSGSHGIGSCMDGCSIWRCAWF